MKRQLSATLPDGYVATRTTARNYTHVVVCKHYRSGLWAVVCWCGSEQLAQKQANAESRIIPVNAQE